MNRKQQEVQTVLQPAIEDPRKPQLCHETDSQKSSSKLNHRQEESLADGDLNSESARAAKNWGIKGEKG